MFNECTEKEENETKLQTTKKEFKALNCSLIDYVKSCEIYNVISAVVVILATLIIVLIALDECKSCFEKLSTETKEVKQNVIGKRSLKKYWTYGRNIEKGFLNNVFEILDTLGYENNQNASDWDLLWAHDYPFRKLYSQLNNLKSHQRVNHFPGCGFLTSKVDLATSGLEFIPPAFKLPEHKENLLKYAENHVSARFVQKHNEHRHIKLRNISEINLDDANGTFIQEFVDQPLLVSGHKFDIGIYTIITSVDPLRLYIYNGDAMLRFCVLKYYPFDLENIDKYVIGDDYLPTWEVPGLKYYYNNLGLGMKESLNAYLRADGKNPNVIWTQIEDILTIAIMDKEPKIINLVKRFKSKHNFFEMMRFDFVVDENLHVYLLEANMSPNLSSAHFPQNKLIYEQVLYNLFSVVGIGIRVHKDTLARSESEVAMESADKNIAVYPEECNSALCRNSCLSTDCQLCKNCLSIENRDELLRAHNEHINRADCKRIFPPPMDKSIAIADDFGKYSEKNQMMYKWFLGKCLLDETWCK